MTTKVPVELSSTPGIVDGSNATAITIDSSENVGIGITSSLEKFTVSNSSSGIVGRFTNNTNQTLDLGVISGSGAAGGVYYNSANSGYQAFQTGGTERVRILSGGGITFNGDTAAANALDDYEEGTFTPTFVLGGGSATVDSSEDLCMYTKIGRLVTVSGRIKVGSVSSPSSFLIITNLPFTVTNFGENSSVNAATCNLYSLASSITGAINAEMHSQGILIRDNGATTGDVQNMADHIDDGTRIAFTGTYNTTD